MTSSAGCSGIDLFGVAAQSAHRIAHGGEVDDRGHAGEVLHQHAGGHVGDLARGLGFGVPGGEEADVVGGDGLTVFVAEQVFKQDAERERQAREVHAFERVEVEVVDGLRAGGERGGGVEAVGMLGVRHGSFSPEWSRAAGLAGSSEGAAAERSEASRCSGGKIKIEGSRGRAGWPQDEAIADPAAVVAATAKALEMSANLHGYNFTLVGLLRLSKKNWQISRGIAEVDAVCEARCASD